MINTEETHNIPAQAKPIGRRRCYTNYAMKRLKMSRGKFERLGLEPIETELNPCGHGGVGYLYDLDVIEALAKNPAEVEKLLNDFKAKKALGSQDASV